jgi:hypothetical protein
MQVMDGAESPPRRSSSGLILLVAGVVVAVFGLTASLTELGSETDVTVNERLAGEPEVVVDEVPPPSTASPGNGSSTGSGS